MTAGLPHPPGAGDGSRGADSGAAEAFVPLARLASLSETLAAQPLGPSPDFRARLRAQLMAEAADATQSAEPSPLTIAPAPDRLLHARHRHPVLRGAAAGIALVLAGGGVAAAAAGNALPGDTLHPLKRFTELLRAAADPHSGDPSDVLREIDVRITELERTSRLGAAPARTGVPFSRWPAMVTALSELRSELGRLAPHAGDPAVRAALLQRRERLAAVLPTLTAKQQPAVQQLIASIDAMTASPATGAVLSAPASGPAPGPAATGLAVPGNMDDVLVALRGDPAPAPAGTPAASPRSTATEAHRTTGTGSRATHARATSTRIASHLHRANGARPTAFSDAGPVVRPETVTVITMTTRTTGSSASSVLASTVTTARRTVTTDTGTGAAVSRTVSTTTSTVITSTVTTTTGAATTAATTGAGDAVAALPTSSLTGTLGRA